MKPVRIFRHIACEGPGYLATLLDKQQIPYEIIRIDANEAVPQTLDEVSGLVFMGGSMSVNDPLEWIADEIRLIQTARQLDMPVRELSLLINRLLNQHFFDFVNSFRIRKAMEMLKDPGKKEFTVLEILYEVGFNSKSSFNTAFKKYTQLTPTQYRNKHLKSAA